MNIKEINVSAEEKGKRLDKLLAEKIRGFSRSYIQKLIDDGMVEVNGKEEKSSYKVKGEDLIILRVPEAREPEIKPKPMNLDIVYEDKDIILVNKPPGLVVHPVPGNWDNTLVNGLLAYTNELSGINGVKRPGIVHRLDKDTSGILLVAKNNKSHHSLVEQFKSRKVKKIYRTIVKGKLPYEQGKIDAPIGRNPNHRKKMAVTSDNSKKAITLFKVIEFYKDYTYLEIELKTGRTHQIRVHLSYLGYPILGDGKYGRKNNSIGVTRQLLHAYKIGFFHPTKDEWQEYAAPIPDDFLNILSKINGLE